MITLTFGFWFVAIWIFGSTYEQQSKSANLNVLVIDNDGGPIGMNFDSNQVCVFLSGIC